LKKITDYLMGIF